jgi:hypothetical protein
MTIDELPFLPGSGPATVIALPVLSQGSPGKFAGSYLCTDKGNDRTKCSKTAQTALYVGLAVK